MARLRTALSGIAISLAVFVVLAAALVAFDLRLHRKFDTVAGLNYRGYRGSVLGRKSPGETRVGLFGGSVAMGYGVKNEMSIASFLERALNERAGRASAYRVVNLAMNAEAEVSFFKANYELFRYLDLDVLIFYVCEDFSSLPPGEPGVPEWAFSGRSSNPVIRTFGYYFVFPAVVREKYYLMKYDSVEQGYRHDALFSRFDRMSDARRRQPAPTTSLKGFVSEVTGENKRVVLALCAGYPSLRAPFKEHVEKPLAGLPRVAVADMAAAFSTGEQGSYFVDNMHYSEKGNRVIAEALAREYIRP